MGFGGKRTRITLRWTTKAKGYMPRRGKQLWGKLKCEDRPNNLRSLMFFEEHIGAGYYDLRKGIVKAMAEITYIEYVYPVGKTPAALEERLEEFRGLDNCEILEVEEVYV